MKLSWNGSAWRIDVECARNSMGGTDVRAELLGAPLKLITFDDWDIDARGFDGIKNRIESEIADQVEAALRLSDGE